MQGAVETSGWWTVKQISLPYCKEKYLTFLVFLNKEYRLLISCLGIDRPQLPYSIGNNTLAKNGLLK